MIQKDLEYLIKAGKIRKVAEPGDFVIINSGTNPEGTLNNMKANSNMYAIKVSDLITEVNSNDPEPEPPLIIRGVMSQTSSNAPIVAEIENTFSNTIGYTRVSSGQYQITTGEPFGTNYIIKMYNLNGFYKYIGSGSTITLTTRDYSGALADNVLDNTYFEITKLV